METDSEPDWEYARAAIRDRMRRLDVLQRQLADRSGMSMATWTTLLNGPARSFSERTLRKASQALGWTPDSIERLLEKQPAFEEAEPVDQARGDMVTVSRDELLRIRSVIDQLLEDNP